ncbi:MAG: class I SAM-dependent methyltransferase [Armatimonadota bacterium]
MATAVTTATDPAPERRAEAARLVSANGWRLEPRRNRSFDVLFAECPGIDRFVVCQKDRLLLVGVDGWQFFFHPNMAYLRLGNLLRGGRDLLVEAADLRPGDHVLDATLGFGSEAILCAYAVGDEGLVEAIDASPEIACVVADGLSRRVTAHAGLNAVMRRVRVAPARHHLDWLRGYGDKSVDVVCFDPFFETPLDAEEALSGLRNFGVHASLSREALDEACRVARRRVVVKGPRWSSTFDELGIRERVGSRSGKVVYGVLRRDASG